jgi:hypothetical protein
MTPTRIFEEKFKYFGMCFVAQWIYFPEVIITVKSFHLGRNAVNGPHCLHLTGQT